MYTFFLILFAIVCVLLILIVLLQSSRASGMELFGSTQNIFGAQSGDILTKTTTVLAILFLAGSFGFGIYQASQPSLVEKKIQEIRTQPAPQQPQQKPVAPVSNTVAPSDKDTSGSKTLQPESPAKNNTSEK